MNSWFMKKKQNPQINLSAKWSTQNVQVCMKKGKFQMPKIIFDAQSMGNKANPQIIKKEVLNLQKRDISIALLICPAPTPSRKTGLLLS